MLSLYLLVSHLTGDYLLQNDWMAQGKKKSSFVCTVHVSFYMFGFILLWMSGLLELWQLAAIAGQHWIQDRTEIVKWYMELIGQKGFLQPPMFPWSAVVVDNVMHLVWIVMVIAIGAS